MTTSSNHNIPPLLGIFLTILMIVIVREACVLLCQYLNIDGAGNVVGLVVMFIVLFSWRLRREQHGKSPLPDWMIKATNKLLVDSGFTFLPISAGAGILLFSMQDEFWGVVVTMIISTLLPMWALAQLTDIWLVSTEKDSSYNQPSIATQNDNGPSK